MKTEKLYDTDSFLSEFEATVLSCEENNGRFSVTLDKTAFFPEGGGQPSDRGFINGAEVFDVRIENDIIYHTVSSGFSVGEKVKGKLDFARRFDFMQQHSGEHIVSGIVNKMLGYDNVGFHLSEDTVTLDFNGNFTDEQIEEIEKAANKSVWQNVAFRTYYPSFLQLSSLDYRSKKELEGDVRIVEINGTDRCACCAPHVKSAAQIGIIKLLDSEKMRGGTRFQLKCGGRALEDYNEKYHNAKNIGAMLSAKQNEIFDAVESLKASLDNEKHNVSEIKKRLISKIVELSDDKTAFFEKGLDIKELQLLSDALYRKSGKMRAVFSETDGGFSFAMCGEAEGLDKFFTDFKSSFNVRGGGRNGMVQGTVLCSEKDLKLYFQF